ncbi:cell wall metabolism sensor histidine kinase WalK [Maritimibacter sp. DP1N21-5]|uniref:sensor histidine kinase n=1 Tax=Maritimibacter sp. DP1N21-5 TaxID=2836867 RepID=UPI001C472DD5|nr:HAMP domain-containing sensor histidine kinase [Maritimibacter sp. DP1N21-5]MBV7407488.1 HAMP domain-containing histidine kinase [Maritimibacter sp. DP1N21-5]
MTGLRATWAARREWFNSTDREQRIKDYVALSNQLVWQRQASFLAAALLTAFYFDPVVASICYAGVFMSELLDQLLGARARAWDGKDPKVGARLLKSITINTIVSSLAIGVFVLSIAVQQTSGGHFTPLFFLFSASLFAAMYNSQLVNILVLRLSIYGLTFLAIAFLDVVRYRPEFSSNIWLEVFTILFVLYFIIDTSMKFYKSYQERLEQMHRIQEEAERTKAAYEIKSQFLSTVSHELRTPLTSIKASLDLVSTGVLGEVPATLTPALSIAAKNSQRLSVLIDDLLDLQKMEAGEMEFNFKKIDVNHLVEEAVESTEGYANKVGIPVTTTLSPAPLAIHGDQARLMQVMNNLLSNALKFSNEGGSVRVHVTSNDNRVRISVQDDGVGIPEEARSKVFEKFSQVDSSDVRKVGGTGLGLNITKQIVDRHKGIIDFESERGVGTNFYVEFDQVIEEANEQLLDERLPLTA